MKISIFIRWIASFVALALLLSACEVGNAPQITPAVDRPTFLYFYTDN